MSFVDQTVAANTDIASSYIAGNTVENRQLKVVKLKVPSPSTSRAVWIGNFNHRLQNKTFRSTYQADFVYFKIAEFMQ